MGNAQQFKVGELEQSSVFSREELIKTFEQFKKKYSNGKMTK